jgi:hydrogenase-4 component B
MMTIQILIIVFFLLCAIGATLPAILAGTHGPRVLLWTGSLSSLALCGASAVVLFTRQPFNARLWNLPELGTLTLIVDHLSASFLFISGLIFLTTSVFSRRYLERYAGHFSLRSFSILYHALFASVALILMAGDVVTFLIGWEVMSILGYLLVNCQHKQNENPEAGYLMLCMGEAGFLAVAVAFLLLGTAAGSLMFASIRSVAATAGPVLRWAVFLLSFVGFSVKTGLAPFNRWLPRVYPVAPANVCALLSGVLLNLGVYGIVRVNGDLLPLASVNPGLIVLAVGSLTALVGILYANRESDMKSMLAESSIENMGIVTAGLGAGFVFIAAHAPALAGIAFIAALYQMLNHSVYKSLLFYGTGSVDATVGTIDMDRLGGLIKRQPWIAAFFLAGALSISALPPSNGFVSEWLTLQALLQSASLGSAGVKVVFALCGAILALTAALAVTCFVKAYAMSFLGMARSEQAKTSGRVHRSMRAAMGFLAFLCLLLGVLPTYVIPVLNRAVRVLTGTNTDAALVPPFFTTGSKRPLLPPAFVADFHNLGAQIGRGVLPGAGLVVLHRGEARNPVVFAMSTSTMFVMLLLLIGSAFLAVRWLLARRRQRTFGPVWAGGLSHLPPELTYTATGFSNPVRVTFNAVFHPTEAEDSREMVAVHFRMAIRRRIEEAHVLDRLLYQPVHGAARWLAASVARMHHGRLNAYVAYVLLTLIAVLVLGRLM